MGIFDTTEQNYVRPVRLTATDAFLSIMYVLIAADGIITDDELNDLHRNVQRTTFMGGISGSEFDSNIARIRSFYKNEGPDGLLSMACTDLPDDLKQGAYIIACDLSFSDGRSTEDEQVILQLISKQLGISDQLVSATHQIITIKNAI